MSHEDSFEPATDRIDHRSSSSTHPLDIPIDAGVDPMRRDGPGGVREHSRGLAAAQARPTQPPGVLRLRRAAPVRGPRPDRHASQGDLHGHVALGAFTEALAPYLG